MRRNHFSFFFASTLLAAGGCSIIVGSELDGKPEACDETFCQGQANGADCSSGGTAKLCVSNCCVVSSCGDGFADPAIPEACDDGNDITNDGCESDCTLSCTAQPDCDDGNPCNGEEECGMNGEGEPICQPNLAAPVPPVGTPCDAPQGDAGTVSGICSSQATCTPI
jgi:cysteine-rich repeat protein